jgi:ATP-dependent RNA helicase RhlB
MNFQRFGIDARLAVAAESLKIDFSLYEKILSHAVENQENICAKINLDEGREEVLLLPALQWLLSGESRKVLVVVPDAQSRDRCAQAVERLGAGAGIGICSVDRASLSKGGPESPVFEGDPASSVVVGRLGDLIVACPPLDLHEYGFLVVDGADRLAELAPDPIRQLIGALLPSWERRTILACSKFSSKVKKLASDLANNPSEISIEGKAAKALSVVKETWSVPGDAKFKFLLGLLEREKPGRACIFCNLKDTAEEVSRRLSANGIGSDFILGALATDRKLVVLEKVKSGECLCLVLTDQGAEGLEAGVFPLLVNYDIPLEPEFFVKRIEMLDRADPAAKVVSLACERYIYGLPAVESYIDAKLEALPADESMLAVADKSEGMDFDRRQRRSEDSRREGGGNGGDARRSEAHRGQRGEGRSGGRGQQRRDGNGNSRDAYRGGNRSRDAFREDRSPDIRKSISEATGGSLEMGGNSGPAEKLPAQAGTRRQQPPRKGDMPRGDGRRGGDRGKQAPQRGQAPRRSGSGFPAKQGQARPGEARQGGGTKTGAGLPKNPYDLPIEERMKQYREKYGQGLGPQKKESPRRGSAARSGPRGNAAPGSPDAAPPRLPPKPQGGQASNKPEGLLGRLFGALKKKSE